MNVGNFKLERIVQSADNPAARSYQFSQAGDGKQGGLHFTTADPTIQDALASGIGQSFALALEPAQTKE